MKTQVFQIHSNLVQLTFGSVPFIWTQFWIIWAWWKIRQNRSQAIMKLKHDAKNRMKTQVFQIHSNFVQLTNGRNRWHFCNFSVDPVFASKIDLWLGNQIDEFFSTNWVLYSFLVTLYSSSVALISNWKRENDRSKNRYPTFIQVFYALNLGL